MINWIHQEHEYGCGIACLAMVCNSTYKQVKDWFLKHNIDIEAKNGGSFFEWELYLSEHGYSNTRRFKTINGIEREEWPPKILGKINLCQVSTKSNRGHAIVLLADGTILDPYSEYNMSLSDYKSVDNILSIYKIE